MPPSPATWAQRAVRMTLAQQVATAYLQLGAYAGGSQSRSCTQTLKTNLLTPEDCSGID
jgi:hypothetical protein